MVSVAFATLRAVGESERSVITWVVSTDHVTYWMHYSDHCELTPLQRQAARHLRECMYRLLRHRDQADTVRKSFTTNAVTGRPQPSAEQRIQFHDATLQFFQTYYGTLSAWSSLLVRVASKLRLNLPSTNSMKGFIQWLGGRSGWLPIAESRLEVMETARQFRALFDHPGQFQPFEWDIFEDEPGFVERVPLYGPTRGALPEGALPRSGPLAAQDGWSFIAPGIFDVTNAIAELMNHYMPFLAGELPLPDDEPVTCPDFEWEREWNGDRAVYSEPSSIYLPESGLVNPVSGKPLEFPSQSKGVARCPLTRAS